MTSNVMRGSYRIELDEDGRQIVTRDNQPEFKEQVEMLARLVLGRTLTASEP